MKTLRFLLVLTLAFQSAAALAETVKDREGAVRTDRATWLKDTRWIYDDWQKGFDEARRTGKPLMVVLRCIPCLACSALDAKVLLEEPEIKPLLDQYVCVRLSNANAIDLTRFQFDYDLSLNILLFNGDGTVYGRYNSWLHQKNAQENATAGFRRALEQGIALHKGYPTNRAALAGKQGAPVAYKLPVDMPELSSRYKRDLDWAGKVVQSCVHCHQIGDAFRDQVRTKNQPLPLSLIYPYPEPETIGLVLSGDQAAHVESVTPGSVAAKAGFLAGDDIVTLAGQPLVSIADVSWVLHHTPDAGNVQAVVKRGGASKPLTISLPDGWRKNSDIGRRVGTWPMRAMATGGLKLDPLPEDQAAQQGLKGKMALIVAHLGAQGKHAAAKNAGFQKGDILVEVDGKSEPLTESALIGQILEKQKPGAKVQTVVLRGAQRVPLALPVQ
jgi:serine protease Do